MRAKIQEAASALIGMPLWAAGRAADLFWFHFGQRRTVTDSRGNSKEVGEYALHLQCAWRIVQGEKIIVASRDLYYPAGSGAVSQEAPPGFHWDVQGANRLDERLQNFMKVASLIVVRVEAGPAGALKVFLGNDTVLEVFPYDSFDEEHWRLFRPYGNGPHFVVGGAGVLEE